MTFCALSATPWPGPRFISCPTCGRTQYPMMEIAKQVEDRLRADGFKKPLKIAIMGCIVNGPGEASDADIGIAGGKDEALLFNPRPACADAQGEHC